MHPDISVSMMASALEQLFGEASLALMAELEEKEGINFQSNDKLSLQQQNGLKEIMGHDASFLFVQYLQNEARKTGK